MNKLSTGLFALLLILASSVRAEPFVVKDIRIEGLQRLSLGAVFNVMPIDVGDEVDANSLARISRILFKTGNFQDIQIARDDDVLVVSVSERPSITTIEIDGNKSIETDNLLDGLSQAGLSEGSVFQRATLDRIKLELERQYISQGRYAARVTPEVTPLPRNRVALKIEIKEGDVATISGIDIVGNHLFEDEELIDLFELKETHFTSFFKGDDKYSKERLSGDLESLRSYYLDRGYVNFRIESTQVSVTPDKTEVYIAVNVHEGKQFKVSEVKLSGDLKVKEEALSRLLLVKEGQTFSRQLVTLTNELITKRLGNEGYMFANVNGVPTANDDDATVSITFYVDPGKRVYVRRVNFFGNTKTRDSVLRREMRQMEGAWANGRLIERSKSRLERLGFFKGVTIDTPKVAGENDQVDVNYTVEEQPSGSIGASLGFQESSGFVFGANVSQSNFLGTGNRVSFAVNKSDTRTSYNFSFVDPYYTIDGVSRGYSVYFQETEIDEDNNLSSWATDRFGGNLTFGYPINETQRLNFGIGYENTKVYASARSALDVHEFIGYDYVDYLVNNANTQNESFNTVSLTGSWTSSTLNRGVFATRGASQSVSMEVAVPGSDLEFYKVKYNGQIYFPIAQSWALRFNTDLGFGDGYGDGNGYNEVSRLPFFENFYAGGFGSVRGYEDRTLGPKENQSVYDFGDPNPFGGNLLIEGSVELIFPIPFVKDKRSVRTLFYLDGGNVFDTHRDDEENLDINADQLRYSVGVGLSWITGIGPLTFSLSKTINDQDDDDTKAFQFSLGKPF
ncbi:outer membrane protein assembly factor BamA [Gammaproteobacteria bacterium 45_16_T64]|nr:outer membrane protein assembly factor BamA [Gammaproteobacteria bacterium 45_16_T64]